MRRSIVKHGPGTLTVSIPAAWAKMNELRAGDQVEVVEHQGQLAITPVDVPKGDAISVTLRGGKRFVARTLYNCYRLGYNEIRASFDDPRTLTTITERVGQLIGFEIVEQTPTSCVLRNVASIAHEEFGVMVRRMWDMQLSIGHSVLDALRKGDREQLATIRSLEKIPYKLYLYAARTVAIAGQRVSPAPYVLMALLTRVESLMDAYRYAAAMFVENPGKPVRIL